MSELEQRVGEETPIAPLNKHKKCGVQAFVNKIVGGEICELDEFPWAAMLLYESSNVIYFTVFFYFSP